MSYIGAGISIQWGAWAGVGLAAQRTAVLARIERSGMGVLQPAQGLTLLQSLLTDAFPAQVPIICPSSSGMLVQTDVSTCRADLNAL